jgi:hypothetical protein
MEDVKVNTSKTLTLTLPSDPTSNLVSVSVYHELGDLVYGPVNASKVSTGVYTITLGQQASGLYILNAAGRHRVEFTYTVSGASYTQAQYINVYTPYTTAADFFISYPELQESKGSLFDRYEKRVRAIIDTYCGQSFDYYPNKSITIDGNNHSNLHLPYPIYTLTKVTQDPGRSYEEVLFDATLPTVNNVERVKQPLNFEASYYIRFKTDTIDKDDTLIVPNSWKAKREYKIEGDFGWGYVPNNVKYAADLLIADLMNDDSEYRRHGVYSIDMDIVKMQMKQSFYESTGNIEADVYLMDYTLFVMDYVV